MATGDDSWRTAFERNHATASEVDAGSRYGVKPTPAKPMHNNRTEGGMVDGPMNAKEQREEAKRLSKRSQQKFIDAVERGEMVRVAQLLDDGQDIDEVCDPVGSTALYVASRRNNLRMAEMLLKRGAKPEVLTDDKVSPAWIAISRGFDQMVELLLDPKWCGKLVEIIKTETTQSLAEAEAGVQQTHLDLAHMRRYWRCLYLLEAAAEVPKEKSRVPEVYYEPADGWAMGLTPTEPGQRPDMPMKPFYWKAFEKNAKCQDEPPDGSKKMVHTGNGYYVKDSIVGGKK